MITALLILVALLVLSGLIGLCHVAWNSGPFGFVWMSSSINLVWELFIVVLKAIASQNE